jgi:hypothetical protein
MKGEAGYILGGVLGIILAISVVAAALVGVSADVSYGVRQQERDTIRESVLEAAIVVLSAQLITDPRRRVIDLESGTTVQVLGRPVKFRIGWETNKLDVNQAAPDAVARRLEDAGVMRDERTRIAAVLAQARAEPAPITLLASLGSARDLEDCLASVLTVFGGQSAFDPQTPGDPTPIGRPATGSKMALDVAVAGEEAQGLSVVLLLTGSAQTPWQIMDWRRSAVLVGETCDKTSS